jgi:hypothetical protein
MDCRILSPAHRETETCPYSTPCSMTFAMTLSGIITRRPTRTLFKQPALINLRKVNGETFRRQLRSELHWKYKHVGKLG